MAIGDETERFARERRDADRRYNDALTALDRAVVSLAERPSLDRADIERLATMLIVFLQQITAFVESKDREVAAIAGARLDELQRAIDPMAELRTQMAVAQRAIQALTRQQSAGDSRQSAIGSRESAVGNQRSGAARPATDDYKYLAFEDQFRGAHVVVEDKLRTYVPIFAGATDVLDLGCGRGELLAALKAAHIPARGVDANGEMAAAARARGLDAHEADALAYVESLEDGSLGGVAATQVVEHLEPSYLTRLLDALWRKLRPGAPIVVETINTACWLAFFSSYIRDLTHARPLHPDTLQYLLRASGFERVEIRYSAPVAEDMKMKQIAVPADVLAATDSVAIAVAAVAHVVNANAAILNSLMFTHMDYAAIGYRV
jgi:SAM-dependent methyltransferase